MLTERIRRLFAEDHLFWVLMASVTGFIAVGKGIKLPNRWSATQAQVDYHFGFVKRGLFGQLITAPLGLQSYKRFVAASSAILILLLVCLVVFTIVSKVAKYLNGYHVPALFFSSYGLTYLVNMCGYFDLLLALLTTAVLMVRNPWARICTALPVSIAAIMIHELFLFAFVPVLILSFLLQAESAPKATGPRLDQRGVLGMALLLAVVSALTGVLTSLRPSLKPEQAALMQVRIQSQTDFPIRPDFLEVMTRSAKDNLIITRHQYSRSKWWTENGVCLLVFGPTIIFLLIITSRLIESDKQAMKITTTLATLAALSPLALHLLGWDATRWNALVVLLAYLVLLTVCRFGRIAKVGLSPAWRNAIALIVVLNIASGSLLLGYTNENVFPFIHSFPVREWMTHGITPPPE